jgi:serine/threonine-protein kinase RsbW
MCDRLTLPIPASVLAACGAACTRAFPGRLDQIRQARALMADFLPGQPGTDDAVLLISELAANAVNHSASGQPGGTFTVRAYLTGTGLYAEVEDQGSAWDGSLHGTEAPHGLFLLQTLSAQCGAHHRPHGWATWFTLTTGVKP